MPSTSPPAANCQRHVTAFAPGVQWRNARVYVDIRGRDLNFAVLDMQQEVAKSVVMGTGTGVEIMRRIAAPMVGGRDHWPLLSMRVVPAVILLLNLRQSR